MNIAILGADDAGRAHLVQALQQALSAELAGGGHHLSDIAPSSLAHLQRQLHDHGLILLMATAQDAQLREALQQTGLHYTVLYGSGEACITSALQTVRHALKLPLPQAVASTTPWRWNCEKCSDPECEHRLFSALLAQDSVRP